MNRSSSLNPRQRAAVEHGDGPLLIVAGAGTGKTRVLVERIGYLLRKSPAAPPSAVLALTFAREAAAEMRQRAVAQFGAPAARCCFSTFHAFCQHLLSQGPPRRALDKVDQWIFLRRNLDELDLHYYFKVSEPGRFLQDLVDFCSRCHDNLVSPDEYQAYLEKLDADCQAAGAAVQCSPEEILRQKEVARVFTLLEQLQDREGLLSFGAMISRAIQLLDSSPAVLSRLRRRYRYILVDEFQDTNTAQFELLVRLAGKRRNLTVVGDDDQAIYRFRGASFASFEQFARAFPEHERIVLDQNYRSTRRILAVAGVAIAVNSEDRYPAGKQLRTDNPDGPPVEIWEFSDDAAPSEYTAQTIAREVKEGRAAYSDFGILYRAHRYRDALVRALKRYAVPFAIRNLSINALPLTRDLIAWLRLIGDRRDSISLARVLTEPRWQLTPAMLIPLCRQAAARRSTLFEAVERVGSGHPWTRSQEFLAFCDRFQSMAQQQKLVAWFPLLLHALDLPQRPQDRQTIKAFQEFLTRWSKEKSATGLLAEFLEYFGYFEEAGGSIGLADEDWAPTRAPDAAGQAALWEEPPEEKLGKVQLMTVHGAKGLEFERVIVWHVLARAFPAAHRKPLIELPPALWKGALPRGDFHIQEERRLFYVALTRARASLVISTISNGRQHPSRFIEDLQQVSPPDLERKRPVLQAASGIAASSQEGVSVSRLADWMAAPVAAPGGELTLSISQLETYRECPLKFHLRRNWQIPAPVTPPLLFGTIVHGAVKEVVFAAAHEPERLTEQTVREILDRRWPVSGFADAVQEQKYRQMGYEQLERLRQVWTTQRLQLLYQEMPFELRLGGCKIIGRVDQIHRHADGQVELVEYKTGGEQTQKDADASLQLTLYALACREVLRLELSGLILYNLRTETKIATSRQERHFAALEKTVREVSQKIQSGRFPAKVGYHCRFCGYRSLCPAQEELGGDSPGAFSGVLENSPGTIEPS